MKLYYHPISSYSQKVLMAFHEKGVAFTPELVNLMDPGARAAYEKVSPMGKVPFLRIEEQDWSVPESTIIIEWLEDNHPTKGTKLIPEDKNMARQVRFRDRFADLYLNEPMSKIFFDGLKPENERDPHGVAAARKTLDKAYGAMEMGLSRHNGPWGMGENFYMNDCAAAPALGYLRMVHPFTNFKALGSYANRLFERPSFMKVMKEAEPFLAAFNGKK